MTEKDEEMARIEDSGHVVVKRQFVLPPWAAVSTILIWVFAAGMLYSTLQQVVSNMSTLSNSIQGMTQRLGDKDVKDAQQDIKIEQLKSDVSEMRGEMYSRGKK